MTRSFLQFVLRALRPVSSRPARAPTAPEALPAEPAEEEAAGVLEYPVTDLLDLHAFRPEDVASVVEEYLAEARASGLSRVRIVHGKGIGVQRAIVRALLARLPAVASFGDAADASGWGATVVVLRPPSGDPETPPADSRAGDPPAS